MNKALLLTLLSVYAFSIVTFGQLTAKEHPVSKQRVISSVNETPKKISELSIGDHVPDFQLKMVNYSSPVASLSDFKGKLVIIDFWATWCYSCIAAWPELNDLQKKFGEKVQFIMVNSIKSTADDEKRVMKVFNKYSEEGPLKFLVAYDDNVAMTMFPHYSLPHYVWITPNGIIKAITESREVTAENISTLLANENTEIQWPVKKDYLPNKLMDLTLSGQLDVNKDLEFFTVFKKGRIDGLVKVNTPRTVLTEDEKETEQRGVSLRNVTIIEMFETALKMKNGIKDYTSKRLVLEVKDSSKLLFDSTKIDRDTWEKNNLYTYDLILPASQIRDMPEMFWHDVLKYLPYKAQIQTRNTHCLVLKEKKPLKAIPYDATLLSTTGWKDGKFYIQNVPCTVLAKLLDEYWEIGLPVIDKTSPTNLRVSIEFDAKKPDLNSIRTQLAAYGLDFKETTLPMDVLVISEK